MLNQPIQRQIRLPLSKAAEIAYKNIRLRLGRSILVMGGIALAIAFWVSIQSTDAIERGMRQWMERAPEAQSQAAQELAARMRARGVPSGSSEIVNARLRGRWLGGLALLVALVGILNAMLMSVTERFREIGTMKCLGALDGFIIKLFLLESLFQGLAGSIVGVLLGFLLSFLSAAWNYGRGAFRSLALDEVVFIALVGLALGLVLTIAGALYPAWQAARMQPVEAMRVEA